MIVRRNQPVLVQGITGRQGRFWTARMRDYGTAVVGGVNPNKAGTTQDGLPVFASAAAARRAVDFEVAVMFVPPMAARAAALDACEAGARLLVVLTEFIPIQDVMAIHAAARHHGTQVVGPNTAGLVTPGECFVGIMPGFSDNIFRPGRVGVVSRSGSLGTLICLNLVQDGYGQSAFVGVGGDPIPGVTFRDALAAFEHDPGTDAVVLVGEIGGDMEERAAEFAATMAKPVVAFIAGRSAPPGRRMGHAGAIVMGSRGSWDSKAEALAEAGVRVLEVPAQVGPALAAALDA